MQRLGESGRSWQAICVIDGCRAILRSIRSWGLKTLQSKFEVYAEATFFAARWGTTIYPSSSLPYNLFRCVAQSHQWAAM